MASKRTMYKSKTLIGLSFLLSPILFVLTAVLYFQLTAPKGDGGISSYTTAHRAFLEVKPPLGLTEHQGQQLKKVFLLEMSGANTPKCENNLKLLQDAIAAIKAPTPSLALQSTQFFSKAQEFCNQTKVQRQQQSRLL